MRKLIIIVGTFVVTAVCFFLVMVLFTFGYGMKNGDRLDRESKEYTDKAVQLIFKNWSTEKLLACGSPELIDATPKKKLVEFFRMYKGLLGSFKKYKGSTGESKIKSNLNLGGILKLKPVDFLITAEYSCIVQFKKKDAQIKVKLVNRDNTWKIYSLFINI